MSEAEEKIIKLPHHDPTGFCTTRATYRQGKKLTAVKVFTVAQESTHLFINGVPSIKLDSELHKLCSRYGPILHMKKIPDYECEPFTECFHIHYKRIQAARHAKRHLDTRGFFGGVLRAFYVPEFETLEETREKLNQRRREIAQRIAFNKGKQPENHPQLVPSTLLKQQNNLKRAINSRKDEEITTQNHSEIKKMKT